MKRGIVLFLLILLAACGTPNEDRTPVDWRTGSQGLVMRFLPSLPAPRIYDDTPMDIVIETFNAGATPVGPNDRIYLSGFDPAYITGISSYGEPLEASEGRTQYNLQGTPQYINFQGIPIKLSARQIDRLPFTLLATACYNYQTVASENVCIDLDPFSPTSRNRVCQATGVSPGTQAAPVAVTQIDVEPAPGRTRFTIYVTNVGPGNPYKPGVEYQAKCSPYDPVGFRFNELDMVRVNDVQISGQSILGSCKPLEDGSHLRLINGVGKLFCEFRGARTTPAYFTPLITYLEYGYRQTIATPVEIIASD